jgi:hypothetical protein
MKLLKLLLCAVVSVVITGCPGLFDLEHKPSTRFNVDLRIINNSTESLWIYFSRIRKEIRVAAENQILQYVYTTYSLEEYADEYAIFGGQIEFCRESADGGSPSRELIKVIDNADSVLLREELQGDPDGRIVYTLVVTDEMLGIGDDD